MGNTNIRQCLRKVKDRHFTVEMKILCSSGVAPYEGDTIKALEDKHSYNPPPPMSSTIFLEPHLVVDIDNFLGELNPSLKEPHVGDTC